MANNQIAFESFELVCDVDLFFNV